MLSGSPDPKPTESSQTILAIVLLRFLFLQFGVTVLVDRLPDVIGDALL